MALSGMLKNEGISEIQLVKVGHGGLDMGFPDRKCVRK